MKKITKLASLTMAVAIMMSSTLTANAGIKERTLEKARAAVKHAAADDWETYARSANMLLQKNVSWEDAKAWLEKSLSISEEAYNLEIMGDYYVLNNQSEKGLQFYLKSLKKINETGSEIRAEKIQRKINLVKGAN